MILSIDDLEDKYWIEGNGLRYEYYPKELRMVCSSSGALLKAIHLVGSCGLDIDWATVDSRSFYLVPKEDYRWKEFLIALNSLAGNMDSVKKEAKRNLLTYNTDNTTGKTLNLFTLRHNVRNLQKRYDEKRIKKEQVCEFFNRYNIEEDADRMARGSDILVIQRSKSVKTAIQEGKDALERLYQKGKLIKLTKEEYIEKMRSYE